MRVNKEALQVWLKHALQYNDYFGSVMIHNRCTMYSILGNFHWCKFSYMRPSTMVVTFWSIRLLKRRLINHISNLRVIYQPVTAARMYKSNKVGGVIVCQVSNFSNSCMASSLLQEGSSFLYLTREISLQQMTKTMPIFLYVRFKELQLSTTDGLSIMVVLVELHVL